MPLQQARPPASSMTVVSNSAALSKPAVVITVLRRSIPHLIEASVIRRVAKEEVALFEGSKVRDFISVIALRLARARLEEYLNDPKRTDLGTRAGDVEISVQQTSVEAAI